MILSPVLTDQPRPNKRDDASIGVIQMCPVFQVIKKDLLRVTSVVNLPLCSTSVLFVMINTGNVVKVLPTVLHQKTKTVVKS